MSDPKIQPLERINNHLLAALPDKEYERLLIKLTQIPFTYAETIYEPGDIIRYVYFPISGIISLLAAVGKRSTLEVGIVGNEGIVGLSVFLGVETSSSLAIVQGAGQAMRMKASDFQKEFAKDGMLSPLLQRFTHSLLIQISQSAACYRFHPIEARLARWLLMTGDRMESNEFKITQDFLSNMLGVRREAVNKAAKVLQQKQLIKYYRGNISIINREGLNTTTCQCYQIIKEEENIFPAKLKTSKRTVPENNNNSPRSENRR
jgi:CRP-like cAMP-binding protein